jgi:four helix bundle protein
MASMGGYAVAKEFANFLIIVRASLSELETQYEVAKRLNHNTESKTIINTMDRAGRLLTGLYKKLRNTADQ